MARLKIGSYILDSADTSSTSTTSGVTFELDGADPMSPVISSGEFLWPTMYAAVTAANEAALKTAVDAVVNAIQRCSGKDIVYEETSGTTLVNMHPNIWPSAIADVEVEWSQTEADIAFNITGGRDGEIPSGSADEPGIRELSWQYEITAGGIAGMIATALFGPVLSGTTVTTGSRENAVTWINKLRNTANYPAWLNTNFRMVSSIIDFEQKMGQSSITESSYDPALVTLSFRELDATLAAAGSWPAQAVSADWSVQMVEREPIDVRSGQPGPGADIELTGTVQLKTEGNTTFNSSETKLTDAQIYTSAQDAVEAVITQFKAVYTSFDLIQLGDPRIHVDAVQGVAGFAVSFTTQAGILRWDESGELTNEWPKVWSRASDGSDWRYANQGGPIRVITHELLIVSLDAPEPYRKPILDGNWDEVGATQKPTVESIYANGQRLYRTVGQSSWRYMNSGPTTISPDASINTLQQITWDNVGDGRI